MLLNRLRLTRWLLCGWFACFSLNAQTLNEDVEVLHWWTSASEAKAAAVLQQAFARAGVNWQDVAVSGGGGESAMMVLQARAIAGNPPTMAQLEGAAIRSWAKLGLIANFEPQAELLHWRDLLSAPVVTTNSYQQQLVAIPLTIHRINWLWLNAQLYQQHQLTPPNSWPEFFQQADYFKQQGITPLALGNEPWQVALVFEMLLLGHSDAAYYQRLWQQGDAAAFNDGRLLQALQDFRRLRAYVGDFAVSSWDQQSRKLAAGEAAMQLMGDWAKVELLNAGISREQLSCVAAPQTQGHFIYNMDSFVFFYPRVAQASDTRSRLAALLMDAQVQHDFNLAKGSIPARDDISLAAFDPCAQKAKADYQQALNGHNLVPSIIDGMALDSGLRDELEELLYRFFIDDKFSQQALIAQWQALLRSYP